MLLITVPRRQKVEASLVSLASFRVIRVHKEILSKRGGNVGPARAAVSWSWGGEAKA